MLEEAALLLRHRYPLGTANRAYYAIHEAACATLLHLGVPLPRTHSQTITAFVEHAVGPAGDIPADEADGMMLALEGRMNADYGRRPRPTMVDARELHEGARVFLDAVAGAYFSEMRPRIPKPPADEGGYHP